ncbi:transmembrane protein 17A-like [Gadus morhua]|uniref:transmembrane protein 17A-like n=1 Tax=Gadus morhua TaxID=8049 RepID=UPI0011B533F9|nr:transmembrane protein 17A-like [Gadus morhua]
MPVFFSPGPQTLRAGLSYVGSAVFANNRTMDSDVAQEQDDRSAVHELVSHLPLQMLLYFNMFYFPCWWASAVAMLHLKVLLKLEWKMNVRNLFWNRKRTTLDSK